MVDAVETEIIEEAGNHLGLNQIIPAAVRTSCLRPSVVEEVGVQASHSWNWWSIVLPIKNRMMILEISVKGFWLDAKKPSNIRDHATLLVEHHITDRVVNKTFEH